MNFVNTHLIHNERRVKEPQVPYDDSNWEHERYFGIFKNGMYFYIFDIHHRTSPFFSVEHVVILLDSSHV